MNQAHQRPPSEGAHRDGLAAVAIILLAIALLIFAATQIIS